MASTGRVRGTTVLSCGCGIRWKRTHDIRSTVIVCQVHGLTTIDHIR